MSEYKELEVTEEQRSQVKAEMAITRHNMKMVILEHLFTLVVSVVLCYFINKNFVTYQPARFLTYFMSVVLVGSSLIDQLFKETMDFREEVVKILKK